MSRGLGDVYKRQALDITLFENNISEPERSVKAPTSRGMTIGDALDEFLGKE